MDLFFSCFLYQEDSIWRTRTHPAGRAKGTAEDAPVAALGTARIARIKTNELFLLSAKSYREKRRRLYYSGNCKGHGTNMGGGLCWAFAGGISAGRPTQCGQRMGPLSAGTRLYTALAP